MHCADTGHGAASLTQKVSYHSNLYFLSSFMAQWLQWQQIGGIGSFMGDGSTTQQQLRLQPDQRLQHALVSSFSVRSICSL